MMTRISEKEQRAVEQGLMTIDDEGRRHCNHRRSVYDFCIECYSDLSPEQMRLMGKDRAASLKEARGGSCNSSV